MKFIDETVITVRAGNGGSGCLSFRREKYIPFGGPDGGDGGDGGSIIIKGTDNLNTLADFKNKSLFKAENGKSGGSKNKHGRNGDDLVINLPLGCVIYDNETDEELFDLDDESKTFTIVKGGEHGYGNVRFKTSTNRAPRKKTNGKEGECREIKIILKVLADVGLVGLPNAGKSSFLQAVSMARPKVADYEFTTLTPNLGVVLYSDYEKFVVADIPGIIEGASKGVGLGIRFLKHISRTKMLLNIIDCASKSYEDITKEMDKIKIELNSYDESLLKKDKWIVINKIDLLEKKDLEDLKKSFDKIKLNVYFISTINKTGIKELTNEIYEFLKYENRIKEI
jgi:GTP-binding protein|uniref:GTPase Obg n=1 Tax=uncultured bacterium BAC13K9BAC TaxID=332979 RepID=Q4JN50_9BACT|nr:predicted GTP-binding protein, GTP1/Obg family [uncultured bacterium BAC13K9BAC]